MSQPDENSMRKLIWERKAAVDAKMAEAGFEALPEVERDAWVLSLQLDVPFETAAMCMRTGEANSVDADVLAGVRAKVAEAFRFGKRKALQELKRVVGRCPALNQPKSDGQVF